MLELPSTDTISVFANYDKESGVSSVEFFWAISPPSETYALHIGRAAVLSLDRNVPLRPNSLSWQIESTSGEAAEIGIQSRINYLFGPEIVGALHSVRELGVVTARFAFTPEQRYRLGQVQYHSPETPEELRPALSAVLRRDIFRV